MYLYSSPRIYLLVVVANPVDNVVLGSYAGGGELDLTFKKLFILFGLLLKN